MSLRRLCVFGAVIAALVMSGTSALAGVEYVTGGSVNFAFGTSDIQFRRNGEREHAYYLTFGGPAIKASFPDLDFTVSANFFPSVRVVPNQDPGVNAVSVVLGFGPSLGYKNWILSVPFYFPGQNQTDVAVGIGYRL